MITLIAGLGAVVGIVAGLLLVYVAFAIEPITATACVIVTLGLAIWRIKQWDRKMRARI